MFGEAIEYVLSAANGTLPDAARIEIKLERDGAIEEVGARARELFLVAKIHH